MDEAQLKQNLTRFGALGLRTEITEMDVGTAYFKGTQAQRFAAQAKIYAAAARACQSSPTCWEFTTWGFTDMPLPFDRSYAPKPAWTEIKKAFGFGTP